MQKYRLSKEGIERLKSFVNIDGETTTHVTTYVTHHVERLLQEIEGEISADELQKKLGVVDAENFKKVYLQPALKENLIEMTIPNKPRSIKQKYRLSKEGIERLKSFVNIDGETTTHVTTYVTHHVERLLQEIEGEISADELQKKLGVVDAENFKKVYLQPALQENLIEMTIPDKPNSRFQKYKLTDEGNKFLIGDSIQEMKIKYIATQVEHHDAQQVSRQVGALLKILKGEMTRAELMKNLKLKDRVNFYIKYLQPALALGLIEMTIPDKPKSSKQKYRLTEKGRNQLKFRTKLDD